MAGDRRLVSLMEAQRGTLIELMSTIIISQANDPDRNTDDPTWIRQLMS